MRNLTASFLFLLVVAWGCHSRCLGDDIRSAIEDRAREAIERSIEAGKEDKIPDPLRKNIQDKGWYKDQVEKRAIKMQQKELKVLQKATPLGARELPLKERAEEKLQR